METARFDLQNNNITCELILQAEMIFGVDFVFLISPGIMEDFSFLLLTLAAL